MPFIKLHGQGINEGETLFVNPVQIECINADVGAVIFPDGSVFWTKETPDEILALIKGEIGSDNKPCECFMGFDKEWISKEAKDKGLTFKECLFFLYFFNTISITPQDREFKAGVEMYKKFAKATVKALGLIKEAEKL